MDNNQDKLNNMPEEAKSEASAPEGLSDATVVVPAIGAQKAAAAAGRESAGEPEPGPAETASP